MRDPIFTTMPPQQGSVHALVDRDPGSGHAAQLPRERAALGVRQRLRGRDFRRSLAAAGGEKFAEGGAYLVERREPAVAGDDSGELAVSAVTPARSITAATALLWSSRLTTGLAARRRRSAETRSIRRMPSRSSATASSSPRSSDSSKSAAA